MEPQLRHLNPHAATRHLQTGPVGAIISDLKAIEILGSVYKLGYSRYLVLDPTYGNQMAANQPVRLALWSIAAASRPIDRLFL